MKNLKIFALAAFALLGFAACQQEELVPQNPTHTVTFVAGAPETTKTTVDISDKETAKFAWTAADAGRFTVYENGAAATRVEAGITKEVMSMLAEFSGDVPSSPKYQALFNSEVSATQIVPKNSYAETTDVMVSEVLDGSNRDDEFVFRFKREVAFAKMTLKGLTNGACVSSVKIESDKPIAGKYDLKTGTFIETSNVITLDVLNDVVEGNATVWFTTIPVEGATFTITATTVDSELNDAATYTKTFAKTISLTRGDVKVFGVGMEELSDPHKSDNGWFLVKDARFLSAGDVIRIGCASAGKVAGALNGQILSSNSATYDGEKMVSISSAEDFTLGGTSGAWTLSTSTGKLGATAVKILSENEKAVNYVGEWSISIDSEGSATIAPNAEEFGRILCNNTNRQERFTTYASFTSSSMLLPGIYKKYGTPAETKKNQTISFNPTSYTATIGAENTYPDLTAQSSGAKTWASSNPEVATIEASTGEITLFAAGETTISVTVAGDDIYKEGTGRYKLTVVDDPIVSSETWLLVTNAADLAVGDVIVIVASDADCALSTTQNTNNRGQQAVTKSGNTVTINDKVQQLTLGEGKEKGSFSLSTGDGYLYAASSSKNYLKTQTTLDKNGSWTITIESNIAKIIAKGTNTNNCLRYNSNSSIFSCYSSGQDDVKIYRKNDTRETQSISYSSATGSIDKYTSVKDLPTLDVSGVKTSVSYTSSTEAVATVSATGEITPLKAGTTTITATAVESAEYREAKASFVLTVTDSTPYLNVSADNTTISANGGEVIITVDTNVDSWSATSSDNDNFALGTPSENTVKVTVAKNTGKERTETITVTAGTLSETITLTQKAAGSTDAKEDKTATITFGTNDVKINSASVNANDDCNNSWTITTVGTTSFTADGGYYQVGSSKKPATSITFTTTLPPDAEVSSIEGKFGGFSGTIGDISLKVGGKEIGSGSLNADSDVTVISTKTDKGNVVTVSITNISKGVKCYYIKVGYKTAK